MEKVFVTGATGFIGKNLVEKMVEKGYHITVLIRNKKSETIFKKKNVNVLIGDITNIHSIKDKIALHTTIVHLAGIRANWAPKELFNEVNTKAVGNLFIKNSQIKHILVTSSVYAMGKLKNLPANENQPLAANDLYGKSKMLAEEITKKKAQDTGIKYTIIRPAIVYGPGDNNLGMINKLITLISKKKFPIIGNGKNLLHLIYIDDLINGYIKVINRGGHNQTYILAADKPIQLIKLVEIIKKNLKMHYKNIHLAKPLMLFIGLITERLYLIGLYFLPKIFKSEPLISKMKIDTISDNWYYDISKAKKELGFRPNVNYEKGISKTTRWFINNSIAKKK